MDQLERLERQHGPDHSRLGDLILTIPEVAKHLKLSKSKVYYLVQRGKIPHVRIGRNVQVKESELRAWLEQNSVTPRN